MKRLIFYSVILYMSISVQSAYAVNPALSANTESLANAYGEMIAARNAGDAAAVKQWSNTIDVLYNENRRLRGEPPLSFKNDNDNRKGGGGSFIPSNRNKNTHDLRNHDSARVIVQFICIVVMCVGCLILIFAV